MKPSHEPARAHLSTGKARVQPQTLNPATARAPLALPSTRRGGPVRKAASGSGRPPARRPGGTERTRPAPAGPGEPRAHPAEAGTVGAPPRARGRANAARPAARRRHSPGRWWSWPPSCPPRRQGARRSRDSFRARAERRALASALRQAAGGGLARVPGSGVTGGGAGGGAGSRHGPGPRPPPRFVPRPGPGGEALAHQGCSRSLVPPAAGLALLGTPRGGAGSRAPPVPRGPSVSRTPGGGGPVSRSEPSPAPLRAAPGSAVRIEIHGKGREQGRWCCHGCSPKEGLQQGTGVLLALRFVI